MSITTPPRTVQEALRRTYLAFRYGAGLDTADVDRLLTGKGHDLSNNRLRNLGLDTDRGRSIDAFELHALVSAWSEEQKADAPAEAPETG